MSLSDHVVVNRRFQRAIRIDTDLYDPSAIEGFICPESTAAALESMARHIGETGQSAFTWTGPYGSGKSSLAVAFNALLSGDVDLRTEAAAIFGDRTASVVWDELPPRDRGWRVLPVVGTRERPAQVIGDAIRKARLVRGKRLTDWSDKVVLDTLVSIANRLRNQSGGLLIFIDEMGKFLEGAALEGTDIYFFQQLAELASRSECRLLVIGILHQSFGEYSQRLSREMRDEWTKIQGRFVDLTITTAADEQIVLLSHAITSECKKPLPNKLASRVASLAFKLPLADLLDGCWPLHPVVTCLLGPISRRRFGQNQRSIFGFLNSPEPCGFQDFLKIAFGEDLYTPDLLFDYLHLNLESSILASPDGHRWAMAVDVLERGNSAGSEEIHNCILKTIAIVDLFKGRSGLVNSLELLKLALPSYPDLEVERAVCELQEWSLIIYRSFRQGYSIFEGSDFDIEKSIDEAYEVIGELDFMRLSELAGLQPVMAKRHFHETGTLRWCDTAVVALKEAEKAIINHKPTYGSVGAFFLALPAQGDNSKGVEQIARNAVLQSADWDVVVGIPDRSSWTITSLAKDLMALEYVRNETPELQGDRIARREVQARISDLRSNLERELGRALDYAFWYQRAWSAQKF